METEGALGEMVGENRVKVGVSDVATICAAGEHQGGQAMDMAFRTLQASGEVGC